MIARLMFDIHDYLHDNMYAPTIVARKAKIPPSRLTSGNEDRISSIVYGSILHLLQVPLREPFFYQAKNPEKTTWGTHHLRIDHRYFYHRVRDAYGARGGMKRVCMLLDQPVPTQLKNFFHYTGDDQRFWLYDRNFIGSLCALFGVTPPPPFWLLRGEAFFTWYEQEYKSND